MTNREIAEKLNISPAALSIIINNKKGVSDATRQRVLQSLNQMGYASLIKSEPVSKPQTPTLCFAVYKRTGEILDVQPFFLLLMENIELRARKYGYSIMFSTIDRRQEPEAQIARMNDLGASGALIFATEMREDDLSAFFQFSAPLVVMDNDMDNLSVNSVAIDNQMGTWQAVKHLYDQGHRKIGYLKSSMPISSFEERDEGYRKAMRKLGIPLDDSMVYPLRYTEDGSQQDFARILKTKPELPTAFVSDDDTIAVGVRRALEEFGYQVPDDISIIGYNDRPMCTVSAPHLTTVNVSKVTFAYEAVDALVNLIQKQNEVRPEDIRARKVRIGTELVVRDSVKQIDKT